MGFGGDSWAMLCTQCEVLDVGEYSDPFDKFLVPYWVFFFSFLCIWDVAHLNCHPFLPIFNHFYPFSIPHVELSYLRPQEGRGGVAILNFPHYGDSGKATLC